MIRRLLGAVLGGFIFLSAMLSVPSCSPDTGDDAVACVAAPLDCQPIVSPPTFDAIYANILRPSCASGTGRCHGGAAAAGLDMTTPESAHSGLSSRVKPDDIGCSLLLRRVESTESSFRMPPGPTPLSEPQRCAIRQWIANGATR